MQQGDTRQGVVETGGGCDTVAHECGWGRERRVSPWYRRGGAFGGAEYSARVGRDVARWCSQLELLLLPTAARSKPLPDNALSIGSKKRAVHRHSHLPRTILRDGHVPEEKKQKKVPHKPRLEEEEEEEEEEDLFVFNDTIEGPREEEEEEEDFFVFNDTIEGPRASAVKPGRVTQA
jgi:hypothetical protein